MRYTTHRFALILAFGLAACGQSAPSPTQTADVLSGNVTGAAAENPQCRKFTLAEISGYLGAPVQSGINAAMGSGCQWPAVGNPDGSFAMLQVVDAQYHETPSAAPGFKTLPDVGTKAFVVPQTDGWQAGAIQGNHSVNVVTSGTATSEAQTVAFLREALKRE